MNKQVILSLIFASTVTCAFAAAPQMPPVAVKTETLKTVNWQQKATMTGKLQAHQGIVVKSEAAGRVTQLLFHSGQDVQAGTPLVQLNDRSIQAQKKIIALDLDLSQKDLRRKEDLYKKRAISKADYDSALIKVKADEAKLEQVNAQLQQMCIKAPFSGKLGLRQISQGDYLTPGQDIVNLQATTPILVNFDVPELIISQLKTGQKVYIESPAYPGKKFDGTVQAIESLINPGSQSLTVQATMSNPKNELIPGTFVSVTLLLGAQQNVLVVPQTSVIYSSNGTFVYTSDGKVAHKTQVQLGQRTKSGVLVKTGLKVGQTIVTVGNMKLYDGAKIMNMSEAHKG